MHTWDLFTTSYTVYYCWHPLINNQVHIWKLSSKWNREGDRNVVDYGAAAGTLSLNKQGQPSLKCSMFLPPATKLGQGYIFTDVCSQGGWCLGRYPPGPGTPPGTRYTPRGRYGQQAGGTHPTGMHSCYELLSMTFSEAETNFHKDKLTFHNKTCMFLKNLILNVSRGNSWILVCLL